MGYTPTAQEVNNLVAQNPAVSQIDKAEVAQYVDPFVVTEQEAKDAYAALGLNKPTEADILKIVGQYDQNDLTGKASENLDAARYNSLLQQIEQLGAQAGVDPAVLDAIKNDINSQITALGGDVSKLQSGVDSVVSEQAKTQAQITDLQNNLSEEIQAAKDIGLEGDAALQAGLDSLSETMGINQADLLTQLGTTAADLKTQFASDIATSQEATAAEIADTRTALETQMKEQYDALTTEQKALADALTAQGTTLTDAIAAAQEQTQTQIGELATDVQAKFDALTEEQKALAISLEQQGVDLNTAIETAQQQTQQQISDLGVEVDARINELMQQGQTYQQATQQAFAEVNAKNQEMAGLIGTQGRTASQQDIDALSQMLSGQREVDLNYDVTGDKQITQADIDFLTQVIGGVKTDWTAPQESPWAATGLYGQIQANELRRQQDLAAADAQRVADQQAAAQAAATQARQANIRTTATRAQTSAQGIMQQLEAMQRAGMAPQQPAQLVEAGPGFDLSDPLNTGFFSGFQAKKEQQNQQPTTKIAAGGYIDDLLAGDMTADDLLNLLR
jgi:regulator of replication initiation timing